jgi:peptidoglycan/xylan/chitin deacetylase (PgdA/CDA1 family)
MKYKLASLLFLMLSLSALLFFNFKISFVLISVFVLLHASLTLFGVFNVKSSLFVETFFRVSRTDAVCLTFDDGPDAEITPCILNLLRKNAIKATFFVIGKLAKEHPDIIKNIHEEGHEIGIHSYRHSLFYNFLSKNKIKNDILKCIDTIKNICGYRPYLYRPPFGLRNPSMRKAVKETGVFCITWDVRGFDNAFKSHEKITKRILNKTAPGSIILLHDGKISGEKNKKEKTLSILNTVIENIRLRGYKFCKIERPY